MLNDDISIFRKLHAAAGPRGRLTPEEAQRYADLAKRLLQQVVKAQNDASGGRAPPRQSVRSRRAMRVDLAWGKETHRAVTMDVGSGGFAALLGATPPPKAAVLARIHLSHSETIELIARVVESRERRGTCRVSFAFVDVAESHRTRLERCLVDAELGDLGGTVAKAG